MANEIQYILYNTPDDGGKVQVVIKDNTLWCTQKAMAQLFGVGVPAISKHLKNIFEEGELNEQVVISKMETTTDHGAMEGKTQTKETKFYHLDAIISVGYRVSSPKATRFRQWATKILNEYIRKGFAMDDERLKQGTAHRLRLRQGRARNARRTRKAIAKLSSNNIVARCTCCSYRLITFAVKQKNTIFVAMKTAPPSGHTAPPAALQHSVTN